jgi:hypothetical protein
MKYEVKDAQVILDALRKAGLEARIVGHLPSEHDIDILITFYGIRPPYRRYLKVMMSLGYKILEGAEDHMEHNLETWGGEDRIVDIWMEERE